MAIDRVKWRLVVEALCATWHEEDRKQVTTTGMAKKKRIDIKKIQCFLLKTMVF